MSDSGISLAAPRSRQITTPAPRHSVFYRPDALPAAQPTNSVETLKPQPKATALQVYQQQRLAIGPLFLTFHTVCRKKTHQSEPFATKWCHNIGTGTGQTYLTFELMAA